MSLKSVYLDIRQLKGLRIDLNFIASKELLENLDYAIQQNKGNYLINIFTSENMKELEHLRKNYLIKVFLNID